MSRLRGAGPERAHPGTDIEARAFSEQNMRLVRRVLLACLAIGATSIVTEMIVLGAHDKFIRYSFPFLLVVVGTFAWVILRRPRVVILFSRAFLTVLVVTWLVVMDERLLAPADAGQGWSALFPQTFMGLVIFAVIGYLVYPTRVALLHALAVTGGSVVVGLIALHTGPDHDAHVADLLRFGVYMLVLTGMVYVLSRAKERAARAFRSAANATIEAAAMREMAYRDPLTGAANRRRLLDELTYQSVATAGGAHVAVVYLDVDHFKRINDERGHLVGDEVLCMVAAVLQRHVRESDLVARVGGEEFVVVAPGMALAEATALADRICSVLPDTVAGVAGTAVTASFGVTALRPGEDPADVLGRVDALMYRAKHAGRDRVVSSVD
ncbi:MAG TPA: GGDEF domain-containing protein [Cellulomonas sp.]|uniref:GGDEF domain-containing protein n=1 Tax=Cellulomonas sp. TaxID=40001 RepID=UPI002E2F0A98|nr:GGDEF domain-containing protein [Cellulomonas sp.]HEX5333638.1 GGDEF domain-containing protein [Cellulomonas sp.]